MSKLSTVAVSLLFTALAHAELPQAVTNELYVSDFANDRVAVYAPDGTYLRSFAAPGMNGPRGIAFLEDGTFFVVSQLNHTVYRFSRDEVSIGQFSNALMTSPTGVAVSPSDEVHVSSFNGARVCVFSLAGAFLRSYTAPNFSTPNCTAFDPDGNIYVASAGRGSVFKFDANEQFLLEIKPPIGVSLTSTMAIARDENDVIWVSGGSSDNLLRFELDGTFLSEITHPHLTGPQGIAFDDRGHAFSSSFYQDVLVEFDPSGAYIATHATGGLDVPRSIAFDPGRFDPGFESLCTGDGGDGAGCTDCPCSNNAEAGSGGGCLNTVNGSARLHVFGSSSLAAHDLRFELDGGVPGALAVLLSGANVAPQNPANPCFGLASGVPSITLDGLRCAVGGILRHGGRPIDAAGHVGAMLPGWGGQNAPPAGILVQAGFGVGAERHFQVIYREDPLAGCGRGLNTSQARSVTVAP